MVISLLAYLATFSGQLYFRKRNFFKLLQSNCFDTVVILLKQLFLQSSFFFEELRFRKSRFLASVIFSECLIFWSETYTEQSLVENRKFFRAVTFRNSHFFGGEIAQNKDIYRRAPLSKKLLLHQLFQKSSIFEKADFSEKKYSAFSTFSEELPFQSGHFFKRHYLLQQLLFQKSYFLTTYFFRRVPTSQPRFLSTATLTFYQLVIK